IGGPMSGHNRWTKIKRQKQAMGATKGKLFNKIIKELTVAARIGGGDPAGNFRLRAAMDAAKEANMPSDHIQRAIKKGTGELEGEGAKKMLRLMELLEESDDVQHVHANFEIDDALMEQLAAG